MNDDAHDAHQYRLRVAKLMLKLFEEAHGRPAHTMEEFDQWAASPEAEAALDYYRGPDGKVFPE